MLQFAEENQFVRIDEVWIEFDRKLLSYKGVYGLCVEIRFHTSYRINGPELLFWVDECQSLSISHIGLYELEKEWQQIAPLNDRMTDSKCANDWSFSLHKGF